MQQDATTLVQYVIYDHPTDFPDDFVVRRFYIGLGIPMPELPIVGTAKTIEEARKWVPDSHSYCIQRLEQDDPNIAEVWMPKEMGETLHQIFGKNK